MADPARFSDLVKRLRRSLGVEVWIDRAEDDQAPAEARPWAVWARERSGRPYMVFPCVDDEGNHVEPGDWCLRALQASRYEVKHGLSSGDVTGWISKRFDARRAAIENRKQSMISERKEELADIAGFVSGATQNWRVGR